ncbi:MAG TPA: NAD(P)-dependent oxidoreductase [Candidatus Limnocylindrales bacterium]
MTGATGRLGTTVLAAVGSQPRWSGIAWTRAEFDLDDPATANAAIERDRPEVVVHCAAWTDVDGCAREPDLALARNGIATGELATACARAGARLVVVSTNEVFDGTRTDRQPYRAADRPSPANPYGVSKRLGEELAGAAFDGSGSELWIARTAWLYGPPGRDFPTKILAAAQQALATGQTLKLVGDEVGCPSSARDVAVGIVALIAHPESAGIHHLVNAGLASRADWARLVMELAGIDVPTEDVPLSTWARPSTPPRWGVLEPTEIPDLGTLRPWREAVAEDTAPRFAAAGVEGNSV